MSEGKSADQAWSKIEGLTQDGIEITVVERTYKKVIHKQSKYRLKDEYNNTGKEVIITAPGQVKVKPGSQYSVDFALAVGSDKYEYHLPLERQRRKMEAAGLDIDVKTLYSLCQGVAEHCERGGVIEAVRADILGDFCAAHMDESPWPILGQDASSSYMWVLSNRLGTIFQFEPTRSGKVAEELLKGHRGAVVTDGYSGYNRFRKKQDRPPELGPPQKEIRLGQCWSHARREFFDRIGDYPKDCTAIVELMDKIFAVESKADTFAELKALRATESRELVKELYRCLLDIRTRYLPGDGISAAANYCLKFWRELTLFLKDLSVPLSNNDAERALRHVVMGRKNFGGSRTINGADTAATLYTVIESAKKAGLQPKEYLKYVVTERWYNRTPKSPHQVALDRFGPNDKLDLPPKDQWRI